MEEGRISELQRTFIENDFETGVQLIVDAIMQIEGAYEAVLKHMLTYDEAVPKLEPDVGEQIVLQDIAEAWLTEYLQRDA